MSHEEDSVYYSVMWRKSTAGPSHPRQQRPWAGDAVLVRHGRKQWALYDMSGKVVARAPVHAPVLTLGDGQTLHMGRREVACQHALAKSAFESGRCFTLSTSNRLSGRPIGPAKDSHNAPNAPANAPAKPRHDPHAPNALVMPAPPPAFMNGAGHAAHAVVVDPWLARHLRPHQRQGVRFLYECVMGYRQHCQDASAVATRQRANDGAGCILADEMGLGKSLQVIALLWTLLKQSPYHARQGQVKRALIVCPTTLVAHWRRECKKWLGDERLRPCVVTGDEGVRDFILGERVYAVMIVGYERLRSLSEQVRRSLKFGLIVCDEGHRLKSSGVKIAQCLGSFACRRRVILTGTPMQNDLLEFHAMSEFVNPGLLGGVAVFKKVYQVPIMRGRQASANDHEKALGQQRAEEIHRLTSTFVLRRTQEVNAAYLLPKTDLVLICALSAVQMVMYRHVLKKVNATHLVGKQAEALQVLNLLRKLSNAPQMVYEYAKQREREEGVVGGVEAVVREYYGVKDEEECEFPVEASGKLQVLMKLLQAVDEKTVVVSNFTQTLDVIETLLDPRTTFRLDGSTPSAKRSELVDQFNSPTHPSRVFLLSSKSGGVGLNLIGATRLVLFDVDWNPATDDQALARVWRDGQLKHVKIYRLVSAGVDEKIFQRGIWKRALQSVLQNDGAAGGVGVEQDVFSVQELKNVFHLHQGECETHALFECACQGLGWLEQGEERENVPPSQKKRRDDDDMISSLRRSEWMQEWRHVSMGYLRTEKREELLEWLGEVDPALVKVIEDQKDGEGVRFMMMKQ